MAKAQRYKEERRVERASAQARQARRSHIVRWAGFLILFTLISTVIGPAAYQRFGHGFLTPNRASEQARSVMQLTTDKGTVTIELRGDKAPKTVKRITELARQGFYNGLTFHRVEPGFVIQGGDPKGDGTGGSETKIGFEVNDLKHGQGAVAMARSPQDKDSADSQFYITLAQQPGLDGDYTVFGQVTAGMDVVERITKGDKIISVTVTP